MSEADHKLIWDMRAIELFVDVSSAQQFIGQVHDKDGDEERKPGGMTRVKEICKLWGLKEEDALDRTT